MDDLSFDRREAMLALLRRHFDGVTRRDFARDLAEKQWVIELVEPESGALRGFSTQCLLDVPVAGRIVRALFSGDTIVDRDHWGDPALSHVWGNLALALIDAHAGQELYWYLISQGYRTYRFLPLFFREFYPRYDCPTPTALRDVLDALGRHKYPRDYDAAHGVIHHRPGGCRLRGGVSVITAGRRRDPHVQFFIERNPGHSAGDELCCLAPLTRENFTSAAYRVIRLASSRDRSGGDRPTAVMNRPLAGVDPPLAGEARGWQPVGLKQ
ncbi:MAG: hypothetical protein HYX69_07000 [Planctomycetia bacterium]|nr:hypothetical protein [Planctomycetia bacterium]